MSSYQEFLLEREMKIIDFLWADYKAWLKNPIYNGGALKAVGCNFKGQIPYVVIKRGERA